MTLREPAPLTLRAFLTRLIWWCVLPLFGLSVGLAIVHVRDVQDDHDRDAARVVKNATATIEQFLSARIGALQILATSPLADEPQHWGELYREASRFHASFGSHVTFDDPRRHVRFHTALPFPGLEMSLPRPQGRSAFETAVVTGRPAVGDLFEGPVANEPMLAIAVPGVRDGRVAFLMVTSIAARDYERVLATVPTPAGWSLALQDSTGRLVARHGPPPRADAQRVTALPAGTPWSVVLEIPRSDQMAPLAVATLAMVFAVLGTTLAGVLGAEWASRRLARSLHALTGSTASGGPAIEIAEVGTVRRLLDEADLARDRADAERREAEVRFRERLEQTSIALQVREAQLRGIFDAASEGIVTIDETKHIVMANPAAARMFGYRIEDLAGAPLENLLPVRHRAGHSLQVRRFAEGGPSAREMLSRPELAGLRADGEEFPIEATISQLHVDGKRLYTAIVRDVTERRRVESELRESKARLESALAELQASHAALQRLVVQHDRIQEDERKRIARELHDDLQQTLAAILIDVTAIRGAVPPDGEPAAALLGRIESMASAALVSTRRIVNDLRPQMLEELGLAAALEALATQFTRRTGVPCDLEADELQPADERQAAPVMTCLYRVAQESLNNVAKHAKARYVQVQLATRDARSVVLRVSDDGKGMAPEDRVKPQSFGLLGMTERVRAVGGSLQVISHPGDGTTVEVVVPLALRSEDGAARRGSGEPGSAREPGLVVVQPVGEARPAPPEQRQPEAKTEPGPPGAQE